MAKGNPNPLPLNDNEVNEMKNLRKKHDHLLDKLHSDPSAAKAAASYDSDSDQSDDEEEDEAYQTKLKQTHKKKQRAGVSAEAYGKWNQKGEFKPKVIVKGAETRDKLKKRLLQAFMFGALDERELEIVVDSIEEVRTKAGEVLIREGDKGDCLYVVEQGTFDCTRKGVHLKEYQPGEGFGELALLYNAPRAATITAKGDGVVWKLDRDTFNHIVKDAAAEKRAKYEKFLSSVSILKLMDPYERS